jgi:hypothetical protein
MKTERDIELEITELELLVSQLQKRGMFENATPIMIANAKIEILKWVLDQEG